MISLLPALKEKMNLVKILTAVLIYLDTCVRHAEAHWQEAWVETSHYDVPEHAFFIRNLSSKISLFWNCEVPRYIM